MKLIVLYYLRLFTRIALLIHRPKIIGVTGSVGKSSTRNAVYAVMKNNFSVKMIREGNSETGIPLGILGIDPGHYRFIDWLRALLLSPFRIFALRGFDYLIVEMGIDSPLPPKNMDYLLTIVKPDIAIVLNVYPVHTMQFDELFKEIKDEKKRMKEVVLSIRKEKLKIITKGEPEIAILNENLALSDLRGQTFGQGKEAKIRYEGYKVTLKGSRFEFIDTVLNKEIGVNIKQYLLPEGYREVFAAAVLTGLNLGLSHEEIVKGLETNFQMPKGRGSIFAGIKSSLIIDSSYNASKAPVLNFLYMAKTIASNEKRPLVVLLGDMRELGDEAQAEHKAVASAVNEIKPDILLLIGPLSKEYVFGEVRMEKGKIKWFRTSLLAGEYLKKNLPYRAIVLVKGSQNQIFLEEAIKKILRNKGDEEKLCRQSEFWKNTKGEFFQGV